MKTLENQHLKKFKRSTKARLIKKFNRLLIKNLLAFLHYKYVLLMGIGGFLLYYIQISLQYEVDFVVIYPISNLLIYVALYKYFSTADSGNPKFMCNKIATRYGVFLLIGTAITFRLLLKLIGDSPFYGLNIYYLMTTVGLLLQGVVLVAMIRTARAEVEKVGYWKRPIRF
jgi:hypothetical protein